MNGIHESRPYDAAGSTSLFRTLPEMLQHRADVDPQRLAYSFQKDHGGSDTLTYAALDMRARAVAAHLQKIGTHGDRVLLLYQSGLDYIVTLFGCAYANRVAVSALPPRPRRPAQGLTAIVRDARPCVALTTAATLASLQSRSDLISPDGPLLVQSVENVADSFAAEWTAPACSSDSLAVLQYTSGSTSMPKAVMITHGNLMSNLAVIERNFAIARDDVGVFWLPPYHDMGLVGSILAPMYAGAPAHFMSAASFLQRPAGWLELIAQRGATLSGAPNFAYELAVQRVPAVQREQVDLRTWRLAFCGGEPVRWQTLMRFADAFGPSGFRRDALYACYGLAESTLMASGRVPPAPLVAMTVDQQALAENRVVPANGSNGSPALVGCGGAPPRHRIAIVNPQTCHGCAAGEVGEIWVSGPSVAPGYWNRPAETAATFAAHRTDTGEGPFLRTGDLGFLQGDELFVTGRIKDLIIIRGRNHHAADLELSIGSAHAALMPAGGAAFAADVDGEERLIVVHEIDRRWRHDALGDVVAAIRRVLSDNHDLQPYAVVLTRVGAVPKTSSGKIRRLACRADYLAGALDVIGEFRPPVPEPVADGNGDRPHAVPADGFANLPDVLRECERMSAARRHEHVLAFFRAAAARIPALKGAELARLDQPLTELGLDSLTMVEFSQALSQALERPLPPTLLFEHPTLDALARYLLNGGSEPGMPAEADAAYREEREAAIQRAATASDAEVEAMLVEKLRAIGALREHPRD
jgi:acyl-CoA synthetase (AMP-forming)/AMP-acid ligase II